MLARPWSKFLVGTTLLTLVACQSSASVETLPLEVQVSLDRTTANRGETVTAVATAQGGVLLGITIDYGDGATDSYNTAGASTAKVSFKHAYTTSGTFTVKAVVTDGVGGDKSAAAQVRVN